MKGPRLCQRPSLKVDRLENRQLLSADGPKATWLGQDGVDRVGPAQVVVPSGVQDIHISLSELPAGRSIASAVIRPEGGGEWWYRGPWGPFAADLVQAAGSNQADLYVEPYQVETGRTFY